MRTFCQFQSVLLCRIWGVHDGRSIGNPFDYWNIVGVIHQWFHPLFHPLLHPLLHPLFHPLFRVGHEWIQLDVRPWEELYMPRMGQLLLLCLNKWGG
jgi:hypothetical protein